jgi:purine-binding chemotaxis protein CheW
VLHDDELVPDAPHHVVFRVGSSLYGLPLESVREVVVPRPPFVRVPRARSAVRGAMNLRGRVVAVVDLARLLGISNEAPQPLEHVVMLDRARRGLGFSVGPVLGVEPLDCAVPVWAGGEKELRRGTAHSQQHGMPVTLLDADVLETQGSALFAPV